MIKMKAEILGHSKSIRMSFAIDDPKYKGKKAVECDAPIELFQGAALEELEIGNSVHIEIEKGILATFEKLA